MDESLVIFVHFSIRNTNDGGGLNAFSFPLPHPPLLSFALFPRPSSPSPALFD